MTLVRTYHETRYQHEDAIFDHWVNPTHGTHGVDPIRRCSFESSGSTPISDPIVLLDHSFSVDPDGKSVVAPV